MNDGSRVNVVPKTGSNKFRITHFTVPGGVPENAPSLNRTAGGNRTPFTESGSPRQRWRILFVVVAENARRSGTVALAGSCLHPLRRPFFPPPCVAPPPQRIPRFRSSLLVELKRTVFSMETLTFRALISWFLMQCLLSFFFFFGPDLDLIVAFQVRCGRSCVAQDCNCESFWVKSWIFFFFNLSKKNWIEKKSSTEFFFLFMFGFWQNFQLSAFNIGNFVEWDGPGAREGSPAMSLTHTASLMMNLSSKKVGSSALIQCFLKESTLVLYVSLRVNV